MQPHQSLSKLVPEAPDLFCSSLNSDPTFKEQAECYMLQLANRKRRPVHASTLVTWTSSLKCWLIPAIGHLHLSQITHATVKPLITAMADAGLKPASIDAHFRLLKRIVDSCLNEDGEPIFKRRWNYDFLDLPVVSLRTMNRPCFSAETVSELARWRFPRERMIFILAGASGARIGELLGLDINEHISSDCSTLRIQRQVARGPIVDYLKTNASYREIDLDLSVAKTLLEFIGTRTSGLLFCSATGSPLALNNILVHHLHPALRELGFTNSITNSHKAGMHALRRFRNTHLGKFPGLPARLHKFWMGHSADSTTDLYDRSIEDREFRKSWAQRCGIGFELL